MEALGEHKPPAKSLVSYFSALNCDTVANFLSAQANCIHLIYHLNTRFTVGYQSSGYYLRLYAY